MGIMLSQAATDTWTGANSANWSDSGNWNPGLPTLGDTLIFDTSGQTAPNNNLTGQLFGGITFTPTGAQYILGGNAITLDTALVVNSNTVLQTIAMPLVLTNAVTFNSVSNIDTTVGDIEVSGALSGDATSSLFKNGGGTLTVDNITTAGSVTVDGGLLVVSNNNGNYTMNGGSLLLNYLTYYTGMNVPFTADSSVGIDLSDNQEPRGVDAYGTFGTAGFKFTKIGQGILRMVGTLNASAIDVTAGTLGSLGGLTQPQTKWGTAPITVESGAMLRVDDGGVCPNAITLNGGDGTSTGGYTHLGALISSSRNNGASVTNFNIFTNTINLTTDSTIGSYYNTMIISGNIGGVGTLTKIGANPLLLSGSNSFVGSLAIGTSTAAGGILQIGSTNAIPATASVMIYGGATLDLAGTNISIGSSLNDDQSGQSKVDNSSATPGILSLNGASINGAVKNTGGGSLSIINVSSTAQLLGANSYSGANIVQGGTLEINIPIGTTTGGPVQIADNATLTLHKTTPGSSMKGTGMVIGTSGATTLNIDLNNYGNASAPIINATNGTGVLSANGTLTINFLNTANLSVGTFPIIRYTTRTGNGNFVLMPIAGIVAKVITNTTAGNNYIGLQITSAPITTWKGNHNDLWDLTTANWTYSGSPVVFADGNAVFFDDTALTNNVNLTNAASPGTAISPGSVLVNSSTNYTFFGTSPLSGGALTKNGSGTLILDVAGNSYASTTIAGGTLQVGNHDSSGDLGSGNIENEGTLVFGLTNNYSVPGVISGAGAVVQNDTNTLTLSPANTYSGGTVVNKGVLKLGNVAALGAPTTATPLATVASGAALDVNGQQNGPALTNAVIISGPGVAANQGAIFNSGGGSWHYGPEIGIQTVQLANDASIGNDGGLWYVGWNSVGGIAGNGHVLTKVGNGTIEIRANVLSSPSQVWITGGTVTLWKNNPFGTATVVLTNNAQWNTWDQPNWIGLTVGNNFVIASNGGQLNDNNNTDYRQGDRDIYNGSFLLNGPLSSTVSSQNGVVGGSITINGPISGVGGLTKAGPYPMTLNGINTYTGPTIINGGTLAISPVSQAGGAYTNNDGGTLDVPNQTGYSTVPMSALSAGSAAGSTISFARVTSLSTSSAVITATNLTMTGNNIILLPANAYASAPGEYPLIQYTTISGYSPGAISVGGGVRGVPGYITNDVAKSQIAYVSPGGTPVVWTGAGGNTWDINNTISWITNAGATTYQQIGSLGDAVTFDDSSSATNVNVAVPVSPTVAIFNLTSRNYILAGTNLTGAASLVKNGTGTLVLSNFNNNFTSGTIINGGTLKVATALQPLVALNNLTGTVTVNNNATLDMGSNNLQTLVINASGAGVGGNGAIQANYSGGGQAWGINTVNQTGNLTIGGNNRWDVRNGTGPKWNVTPNGATLTKVGAGYVGLNSVTVSTNLGDITILGGTLDFQTSTTGLGNTNNTIYVGNGGNLGMFQLATPIYKSIVCSNGAGITGDGGNSASQNVIVSPVTLVSGTVNLNFNYYNWGTFSNTISGAGGLNLQVQSVLRFAASNTYSGNTTIPRCNGQTDGFGTRIMLIGNGSMTKSPLITMSGVQSGQAYAGFIDVLGRSDQTLTLATNQTLRGDNGSFVRGSVVVQAGAAIAPGGINQSNYQYMAISNTLTFQAGCTNYMDIYKAGTLLTNDLITVGNLVTFGGTLQIQTNGPTPLAVNDSFKLFRAGSATGNFPAIVDKSGTTWSFNPATGVATVTALPPTVNTNPATANFQAAFAAGALHFTWASDYLGWQLYTNAVSLTAQASWFPISGSAAVTNETININPANPNVFFQLRYP